MTLANQIKMTAEQYLMLGEDPPGVRLELVHGEVGVSPSPAYGHAYTDKMLSRILLNHIVDHDLGSLVGDLDTILDPFNVRRPDIIFIAKAQLKLVTKEHGLRFAPELCVEIISPSSATADQSDKPELYAKRGIKHYWLVDPENRWAKAHRLRKGKYVQTDSGRDDDVVTFEPFPKLKIRLAEIWSPL